ncbi:hypothetical protein ACFTAO_30025 [Paenibacillus rhizoplanae]
MMNAKSQLTVTFLPDNCSASVKHGVSLLEAVRKAGIKLPTRCGGQGGMYDVQSIRGECRCRST